MGSWAETEQAVGHTHAAISHHGEPAFRGHCRGVVGVRPALESDHLRADGDGVASNGFRLVRWPEDVDHVDRNVDVAQ